MRQDKIILGKVRQDETRREKQKRKGETKKI